MTDLIDLGPGVLLLAALCLFYAGMLAGWWGAHRVLRTEQMLGELGGMGEAQRRTHEKTAADAAPPTQPTPRIRAGQPAPIVTQLTAGLRAHIATSAGHAARQDAAGIGRCCANPYRRGSPEHAAWAGAYADEWGAQLARQRLAGGAGATHGITGAAHVRPITTRPGPAQPDA